MTRIEQALDRLANAVDLLEEAGNSRLETLAVAGGDDEELRRLSTELSAVRSDYHNLQLTSQQASGRIDTAIGRLRAVLEV